MWGGDWHPDLIPQPGDVVVEQHWGQNGFANTDLDFQLKQRGIEKIIVGGVVANTCVEGTARYGAELGYHVTLVRDATAAFSPEAMHAAHGIMTMPKTLTISATRSRSPPSASRIAAINTSPTPRAWR